MTDEDLRMLDEWRHDRISEADFETMQTRLHEDAELRAALRGLADVESGLAALAIQPLPVSIPLTPENQQKNQPAAAAGPRIWFPWVLAAAASFVAVVSWWPKGGADAQFAADFESSSAYEDRWASNYQYLPDADGEKNTSYELFSFGGGGGGGGGSGGSDEESIAKWGAAPAGEAPAVRFAMPDPEATNLNRVTGGSNSTLNGMLNADGTIWISGAEGADEQDPGADGGIAFASGNDGSLQTEAETTPQLFYRDHLFLDETYQDQKDSDRRRRDSVANHEIPELSRLPGPGAAFRNGELPDDETVDLAGTIVVGGSIDAKGVEGTGGAVEFEAEELLKNQLGRIQSSGQSGGELAKAENQPLSFARETEAEDDKKKEDEVAKAPGREAANHLAQIHDTRDDAFVSDEDAIAERAPGFGEGWKSSFDDNSTLEGLADFGEVEWAGRSRGEDPDFDSNSGPDRFDGRFRYANATGITDKFTPLFKQHDFDKDGVGAIPLHRPTAIQFPEILASNEPFSTFSLNVSDVSFKLAQASLANQQWPDGARIRIEEFVNAFNYGDPMPANRDRIACRHEQAAHPVFTGRNLLRISMRTAEAGRSSQTPLRLTILLDQSGSMDREDRRETVGRAIWLLTQQLLENDSVTLIGFARQPRLLADQVSGTEAGRAFANVFARTASDGGTNLEAALNLALNKAAEQKTEGAQNRIVLITDGAANLGNADPDRLRGIVETMRLNGIAFDAAGVGANGLNDETLEALTRNGDGRYYFLDRPEDADDGFAKQIAGALRPAAMNVKVQVEFNPKRVGRYKLLGYEKHRLAKEDFRNDAVDAAELAAAEAGVALYQIEPLPGGEGDVGTVSVRFRDMSTGQMVERHWPIPYEPTPARIDKAAPSIRLAAAAAFLAAKLKRDPIAEAAELSEFEQLVRALPVRQANDPRVQQLLKMIGQARRISE